MTKLARILYGTVAIGITAAAVILGLIAATHSGG